MDFTFYGKNPPVTILKVQIGGICPHCSVAARYSLTSNPISNKLQNKDLGEFVASYVCDACKKFIPVLWKIRGWDQSWPIVADPESILPFKTPFDFEYVPDEVSAEIQESLRCLSVKAFNGFASQCRRAVQSICTNLGAQNSFRVEKQIDEMVKLVGISDELKEMTKQIMLTGHDGAHPHLPKVDLERSNLLVKLLQDLTYELYTRPGKIKEADILRKNAIKNS